MVIKPASNQIKVEVTSPGVGWPKILCLTKFDPPNKSENSAVPSSKNGRILKNLGMFLSNFLR